MRDSVAVEKHYRVKELADLWGFSQNTIIKLFSNEDGVLRLESPTGKRKYATLSIPESVAILVHESWQPGPQGESRAAEATSRNTSP